jgi:hypothetical protein
LLGYRIAQKSLIDQLLSVDRGRYLKTGYLNSANAANSRDALSIRDAANLVPRPPIPGNAFSSNLGGAAMNVANATTVHGLVLVA